MIILKEDEEYEKEKWEGVFFREKNIKFLKVKIW